LYITDNNVSLLFVCLYNAFSVALNVAIIGIYSKTSQLSELRITFFLRKRQNRPSWRDWLL